jgi:hypothetical protein
VTQASPWFSVVSKSLRKGSRVVSPEHKLHPSTMNLDVDHSRIVANGADLGIPVVVYLLIKVTHKFTSEVPRRVVGDGKQLNDR